VTHLSKLLAAELDAFRAKTGRKNLSILETGSIRNTGEEYHQNDGWSTLTFALQVADHGGSFTSVDLDIDAAETVLTRHGVREHVNLVRGHSIDVLAGYLSHREDTRDTFDVVLLDSENDASLIMHEFLLVKRMLSIPALILVDDVELNSATVVKGHQLVPWLQAAGIPYRVETRTGDGYSTGVLVFEL
jgi:hypothetical protein